MCRLKIIRSSICMMFYVDFVAIPAYSKIIELPVDVRVPLGSDVTYVCVTDQVTARVDWRKIANASGPFSLAQQIVTEGLFNNEFAPRYYVTQDGGTSTLMIRSIIKPDVGTFQCIDDDGLGDHAAVTLLIAEPKTDTELRQLDSTLPTVSTIEDTSEAHQQLQPRVAQLLDNQQVKTSPADPTAPTIGGVNIPSTGSDWVIICIAVGVGTSTIVIVGTVFVITLRRKTCLNYQVMRPPNRTGRQDSNRSTDSEAPLCPRELQTHVDTSPIVENQMIRKGLTLKYGETG